ncbi:uncharacterized protein LACBIDRAFT_325839 [Laccaria bicolor S238N-H82]|uniref:Predicted protein n=1 Tax=Laccaria bicolor (strain S238N-H82 / ATCC MYA-4686) TaxID=486041 RepID=B0D6E5_LACBS|nr:uncharacterized protein LACBIDRAFT_325839 [Laccaria bicolor S238N-H82]EDR09939.1 predicted protein [Laccaria bicolor S238N-H82]|eukprot:XP_001879324.1 predicted protein [Laccaria bicolor S238N-H82]
MEYIEGVDCNSKDVELAAKAVQTLISLEAPPDGRDNARTRWWGIFMIIFINHRRFLCPSDFNKGNFRKRTTEDGQLIVVTLDFTATCFMPQPFIEVALRKSWDIFSQMVAMKVTYTPSDDALALLSASGPLIQYGFGPVALPSGVSRRVNDTLYLYGWRLLLFYVPRSKLLSRGGGSYGDDRLGKGFGGLFPEGTLRRRSRYIVNRVCLRETSLENTFLTLEIPESTHVPSPALSGIPSFCAANSILRYSKLPRRKDSTLNPQHIIIIQQQFTYVQVLKVFKALRLWTSWTEKAKLRGVVDFTAASAHP